MHGLIVIAVLEFSHVLTRLEITCYIEVVHTDSLIAHCRTRSYLDTVEIHHVLRWL